MLDSTPDRSGAPNPAPALAEPLDCVVIGYNDPPFEAYAELLAGYGEDSEAYRDLQLSFAEVDGEKMTYVDLFNHVFERARPGFAEDQPFLSGEIPNLAAAYLVNFLRREGHQADYINLFQQEKDRLAQLLAAGPRCVAITTTFYVINFPVNEMVEFIRSHAPDVPIVVGGPLAANHHRNYQGEDLRAALDDIGADIYVIEGQGEKSLADIVQCLKDDGDLAQVPNLVLLRDGEVVRSPVVPENNSLDECAIDWATLSDQDMGPTLQTRTARSCAFSCAFCNYPTRAGKLTLASLETIEQELDSMASLGDVENVVFIDDTFNVPLPRFKDICRLMIRKNYGFNWFSYFRCSNSDDEAFELMAQSGCKGVFLGIESGSPTILKNMSKHATIEKYENGIAKLKEHGILTFGSFILGFPGETDETVQETEDFIRRTGLDYYRIQMWYNEPGTPIHNKKDEFEIDGEGFVWSHASMDSAEAMDHIERIFLSLQSSVWMPQWSFDFWIIPYLMGRGVSLDLFQELMAGCHRLLALEIAFVAPEEKRRLQQQTLDTMVEAIKARAAAA